MLLLKRYNLYLDLVLIAIATLAGHSQAHIGGLVFPIYEIPADHVPNLHEGSLQEWASFAPNSSFNIDDLASPIWGIFGDRGINVTDFNVEVYLGWSRDSQEIYVGIQRMDDFYIGSCDDLDDADAIWGYDALEIAIDGDHSGGYYAFPAEQSVSIGVAGIQYEGPLFSQKLPPEDISSSADYVQAQHFYVLEDRAGFQVVRLGAPPQSTWLTEPPYAEVGGGQNRGVQDTTIVELMITPFDDWDRNGPTDSRPSVLKSNVIIGMQFGFFDYDECGSLNNYQSLSGQARIREDADTFADFLLLPCEGCGETAVQRDAWGRIKANF